MKQLSRLCLSVVCLTGCAHSAQTETPPAATASAPTASQPAPQQGAIEAAASVNCKTDSQCQNSQICVQDKCVEASAAAGECTAQRLHFPFNSADLDDTQKNGLTRAGHCLMGNTSMKMTIEGNADERGTEEYNLGLGEQRARAIAKYLEALGVSSVQLKTVSYGKDQPLCTQHDEACWQTNRRAALKVGKMASDAP